jgi:hypothetical protein
VENLSKQTERKKRFISLHRGKNEKKKQGKLHGTAYLIIIANSLPPKMYAFFNLKTMCEEAGGGIVSK